MVLFFLFLQQLELQRAIMKKVLLLLLIALVSVGELEATGRIYPCMHVT